MLPTLPPQPRPLHDRLARRYIHQARQAMAALGGALHDPPAVSRCLATAEALLSGDAAGEWTIPTSLPSSLIYKVRNANSRPENGIDFKVRRPRRLCSRPAVKQ